MNRLSKYQTPRHPLRGMPETDLVSAQTVRWFQTTQGEAVLRAEMEAIQPILEKLFGYHILQLGFSDEHSLIDDSPVGHKIVFASSYRAGSSKPVAVNEELPLANESIDVVVIHHALDFTADSHRLLREATRVLRPGGHMLIIGFNPYSVWGFWKLFKSKKIVPWSGRFIAKGRVTDWLKLLNLHIDTVSYGLHFMPLKFSKLVKHAPGLEKFGNSIRSPLGGVYYIHCSKQVVPLTPILPRWIPLPARPSVMPAAENVRAKIH